MLAWVLGLEQASFCYGTCISIDFKATFWFNWLLQRPLEHNPDVSRKPWAGSMVLSAFLFDGRVFYGKLSVIFEGLERKSSA